MTAYDELFEHVFARIDPERAHQLGFRAVRLGAPLLAVARPGRAPAAHHVMGLEFPNRLGLAAGFDKNARGIDALAALGFGHVEIGTVTALAQPGNPAPRLFRLPRDRALVNRMGFNNDGAKVVAGRLADRGARKHQGDGPAVVLGVNIGKSKVVPETDHAAVLRDYQTSAALLAPYADYLVVNVSSPNTPGLRNLQATERLAPLLQAVRRRADDVTTTRVPLLVKIAPDLADEDVVDVARMAREVGLDGVIATNTTVARSGLRTDPEVVASMGAGGLSGAPLKERATEVLRLLRATVGADLALIGVGGVSTPADARERLEAGADLVQAYTAFIYGGPLWPRRVAAALS